MGFSGMQVVGSTTAHTHTNAAGNGGFFTVTAVALG